MLIYFCRTLIEPLLWVSHLRGMPDKESTSLLGLQEGAPPEGGGGVMPRLSTCRAEGALSPHWVLTVTPRCTERFRYALRETQRNRVTCGWRGGGGVAATCRQRDQGPRGQPPRGRRGHARAHPSLTRGQVLGRRGRRKAGDVGHVRVFSVFPLSTPPIGCVEVKWSIFRDGGVGAENFPGLPGRVQWPP